MMKRTPCAVFWSHHSHFSIIGVRTHDRVIQTPRQLVQAKQEVLGIQFTMLTCAVCNWLVELISL